MEDGVLLEAQDGLDAVDGGRVVGGSLDGARRGGQALVHHHHLRGGSEEPHWSVGRLSKKNNDIEPKEKISGRKSKLFFYAVAPISFMHLPL